MVRTVEPLGYLTRTRSRTDKRAAELTLTRAGKKAFATARRLAGKAARELFRNVQRRGNGDARRTADPISGGRLAWNITTPPTFLGGVVDS